MKKLLLILLFLPLFSSAQNWHSVPLGQHNIYRVSVPGVDSNWDGYLRNIHVESVVLSFNGAINHFYTSLRKDSTELLDTLKGATWLGRSYFRALNGDEIFLNKYYDSIRIKTLGNLNDSWIIGYDTSGRRFEGNITSIDTMTIDGIADSIKKISIQAYNGMLPVPSIYNNYELILSKSHGFYQTLDFYGFPNNQNAIRSTGWGLDPLTYDVFPTLPYLHVRIDSAITNQGIGFNNLQYQFQPGNEWIIDYSGHPSRTYVTYDSIISSSFLGSDTAIVLFRRDSLYDRIINPIGGAPYWQITFSSSTYTDTVFSTQNQINNIRLDSTENVQWWNSDMYNYYDWKFIKPFCLDKFIVFDTSSFRTPVSMNRWAGSKLYEGLNISSYNFRTYVGSSQTSGYRNVDYLNINGCKNGTFYSLRPIGLRSITKDNNLFKIYPNPSYEQFYIQSEQDWDKVDIINLQGKVVKSFTSAEQNDMRIINLPPGLYLIKIATKEGNYIYKLLKE